MKYITKITEFFSAKETTRSLGNIILFGAVLLLLSYLGGTYNNLIESVIAIISPFAVGFVIAFALSRIIERLSKHINRTLAVLLVYVMIAALFIWISFLIVPMVIENVSKMIPQVTIGLSNLEEWVALHTSYDIRPVMTSVIDQITEFVRNLSFMNNAFELFTSIINNALNIVIYFILAIYMSYNYQHIRNHIKKIVSHIDVHLVEYFSDIEDSLHTYFKAYAIGACIQAIEFWIVYLLVGNSNWLVLGILAGVASIIPYVGAISANLVGVLATFYLGLDKVIILMLLIVFQSNIDSYVIGPRIYSANTGLSFISVLFGIFAGSALFGVVGMLVAIPVLVIVKSCRQRYLKNHHKEEVF